MKNKSCIYWVVVPSIIIFLIFYLIDPLGSQSYVFFARTGDLFADFFNVLRFISDGNPFFNGIGRDTDKAYLPFVYLLMNPFSSVCDYTNISYNECFEHKEAIVSCLMFTLISVTVFIHSISLHFDDYKHKSLYLFICLFSSVFLFTIERGNMLFVSCAMVFYFLKYYNSEKRNVRYLASFALCIASVIKVYPVLFGLLLLKDKRYNEIVFCVICTLCLIFLPFMCFEHGFDNIPKLMDNIKLHNVDYDFRWRGYCYSFAHVIYNTILIVTKDTDLSYAFGLYLGRGITIVLSLMSIYLVFKCQDRRTSILLITFVLLFFPSSSIYYCGLYLLLPILQWLKEDSFSRIDYIYILSFAIALIPLQIVVKSISINYVIANVALGICWMVSLCNCMRQLKTAEK